LVPVLIIPMFVEPFFAGCHCWDLLGQLAILALSG
jgi:hypothetical protein